MAVVGPGEVFGELPPRKERGGERRPPGKQRRVGERKGGQAPSAASSPPAPKGNASSTAGGKVPAVASREVAQQLLAATVDVSKVLPPLLLLSLHPLPLPAVF